MRKLAMMLVFGVLIGALSPQDAAAQTLWEDRGYININFGVESGNSEMIDTKTFTIYDEQGSVTTQTNWTSGGFFDAGLGFRLFRNFSAGVAFHQEQNTTNAAITGSIPNPFFFNRPRTVAHTENGLERMERAVHIVLGWTIPVGDKLDVMVFGGPTFFRLNQDVISDIDAAEKGAPFTEVVIESTVTERSRSVTGYNLGADASYMLWENDSVRLGVGGFFRFTGATTTVAMIANDVETKVGGTQFGFGGRIRF